MTYMLANAQQVGDREDQQDAFAFSDPADRALVSHGGVVAVLADGMGGLRHGAAVARAGVRAFLDAYKKKDRAEDIPAALERSLVASNDAVLAFVRQLHAEGAAATTLVAAVLRGQELFWVSAGDSRAYLVREQRAYRLTVDHTGRDDAFVHARGHSLASNVTDHASVTSFLGMPVRPRMDRSLRPFAVRSGDCVLLASDGLYDALTEEEIGKACERDLNASCTALVDMVLRRRVPEQDNLTVMAMACSTK